jgi:uncharacterized protein (DUF2141 family)
MPLPALIALPLIGAAPAGRVDIDVAALRSHKGALMLCLTRNPAFFPACKGDANAQHLIAAPDGNPLHFANLPSGDYALAIIHDENGNGQLDRMAGIPSEGVGFSRNPRLFFGPPRFAAARFRVDGGPVAQNIRMKYFL